MSSAAEVDEEQLGLEAIWGDRARQLVAFVQARKPTVATRMQVCHFAGARGWLEPTREGIIRYAVDNKLLVAYRAVSGLAYKIPYTPVFDAAGDSATSTPSAPDDVGASRPAAVVPSHSDMLDDQPEENRMAKDWISTAEAAELLGHTKSYTIALGHKGVVEAKQDGKGARAPFLFNRASSAQAHRRAQEPGRSQGPPPAARAEGGAADCEARARSQGGGSGTRGGCRADGGSRRRCPRAPAQPRPRVDDPR
jgi:hypothetical protein